jgi:hypothetical protein
MRPPRMAAALLAAACAALGAFPVAALAACDYHPPHPLEFQKSSMVVMGQAVAKARNAGFTDYTFKVDRQLKGKPVKSLLIKSENTSAGFPMDAQRTYLIFVSQRADKSWYVDNCGNSAPMSRKASPAAQ